ncbi:hypothetical protein BU14_0111s0045 [Porphyra umbilicalis]|uniref:Uncharacterized protein n=1 Tax=Porphyra umbilicalis TaxID=2786 RepID=A0A1X6PCA6_PORUM|nr:hypothetical protein BU14_0111s0045 [Porphyra umbilicalis]|eukprot:OSX78376.1 hypothetical protein BU14_0111s0045 [Porphyra umbilicalis]
MDASVLGPTPHPGRLASLCSPYVWRSATPSPLTAPAPCIIHALLLLALEGSFAGSMLGKRGLSFTNDRVVATSRVGGCVAKGSVPSVCARVEGLGGVDGALAPLRPLGDTRGNQAGWRVSRVMQARASGVRENPLEC